MLSFVLPWSYRPFTTSASTFRLHTQYNSTYEMARQCTFSPITTRLTNICFDDNDLEMKYDPCRKATQREYEMSPLVEEQQGFTCTYVPNEETHENTPMSPISVTLDQKLPPPQPQPQTELVGTWDELVRNEITLGDTGAPAALDPDDMPAAISGQEQGARKERGGEGKRETWSALVEVEAVLGDDGTDVLDMNKKVKLWGLTCGV